MEPYNQARHVYCLSISLIEPTTLDPKATQARQDRFSVLLAEQIKSHLENLGLTDILVKFTGDEWLLMTGEDEKLPALSCLALIMASTFNEEITHITGLAAEHAPALHIAIGSGKDRFIELPDGRKDFIGGSARNAGAIAQFCKPNEILVDEVAGCALSGEFEAMAIDSNARTSAHESGEKEHNTPLYMLSGIKDRAVDTAQDPSYLIYTLNATGKVEDATASSERIVEHFAAETHSADIGQELKLKRWNRLVQNVPDYESAVKVFARIKDSGLTPDVVTYNALVTKAPDFDVAHSWLDALKQDGVRPDVATYNALIAKSGDNKRIKALLEMMQTEGIRPDTATYSALISKAGDYVAAKSLHEMMLKEAIRPNLSIYNSLVFKASDYDTARALLDDMVSRNIQPDLTTYNALISKATEFEKAKFWLDVMLEEAIQPNLTAYNRLIAKVDEYDKASSLLDAMKGEGIQPNIVTYNTLITKAPSYDIAEALTGTMKNEGIEPNVDSYNRLFSKNISGKSAEDILSWYASQNFDSDEPLQAAISSYRKWGRIDHALRMAVEYPQLPVSKKLIKEIMEEVLNYLETIQDGSIEADVAGYNVLIDKAPYFDTAKSWLDTMHAKGIKPDLSTYTIMISKAPDYDTAKSLLDAMIKDGLQPDTNIYNSLFSKNLSNKSADDILSWYLIQEFHPDEPIEAAIESYRAAKLIEQALRLALEYSHLSASRALIKEHMEDVFEYLSAIREEGVRPDVVTYSTLISKAPFYTIAEAWLDTMEKKGVKPNVVTYNTLISKAGDYDTAKVWLDTMEKEGIRPTVVTYGALIAKAPDFTTAKKLLGDMLEADIEPNTITYNALILKAADYDAITAVLDVMRRTGIKPDVNSYNALIAKAPDYTTAESLVEAMQKEGVRPSIVTYNRLFSKNLSSKPADDLIRWYQSQPYHPDEPIQAAIASYRNIGLIDQALRLAAEYAHLQVVQKLIKEHMEEALSYFKMISDDKPEVRDISATDENSGEHGKQWGSREHVKRSLSVESQSPKRMTIKDWIDQLELELSRMV